MKKTKTLFFAFICFLFFQITIKAQPIFMADQVISSFDPGTSLIQINEFFTDNNLIVDEGPLPILNAYLSHFDPSVNWPTGPTSNNAYNPLNGIIVNNTSSSINGLGINYLTTPPDPGFVGEFDLTQHHPLEVCGSSNYYIDVTQHGNNLVNGAIFDTGVDYTLLFGGFFDPQNLGKSFIENINDPIDDHDPGHGTHNSSTMILSTPSGIDLSVQLNAYKTHDYLGVGSIWNLMKGIEHAMVNNIQVVNMSLSFPADHEHRFDQQAPLKVAIDVARNTSGILFIAAAGNDGANNDNLLGYSNYPASYLSDNIIAVAASDCSNNIVDFSNWGAQSVDIAAPGVEIWGLGIDGHFVKISGTSMACAFVSRVALQLGTKQSAFDWEEIKCAIINGANITSTLYDKVLAGGYLDARGAESVLERQDCTLPQGPPEATHRSSEIEISYTNTTDQINIHSDADQNATIHVFNVLGQILSSEKIQLQEGLSTYDLSWKTTSEPAIYFVTLQYEGQNKTIKIIR